MVVLERPDRSPIAFKIFILTLFLSCFMFLLLSRLRSSVSRRPRSPAARRPSPRIDLHAIAAQEEAQAAQLAVEAAKVTAADAEREVARAEAEREAPRTVR